MALCILVPFESRLIVGTGKYRSFQEMTLPRHLGRGHGHRRGAPRRT
ncbi:MAG: hypothetical protein R2748_03800 [Bryobacterales bacterium]